MVASFSAARTHVSLTPEDVDGFRSLVYGLRRPCLSAAALENQATTSEKGEGGDDEEHTEALPQGRSLPQLSPGGKNADDGDDQAAQARHAGR